MGTIERDLQGHFGLKLSNLDKIRLVTAIIRQGLKLEPPYSHKICILGPLRLLLNMGTFDLDLQGHFGLKRTNFRKIWLIRVITH